MMDQNHKARRAVVLLSGGLDSATCLAWARKQGYLPYALSFRYGQRHSLELEASARVAAQLGVQAHVTLDLDLRAFGGSALTADIDVPKHASDAEIGAGVPITYVPARNTVFLSLALGWAEVLEAEAIVIGVNEVDYSGYPDCRPEFIEAFTQMAHLATRGGVEGSWRVKIEAPLLNLSKAAIIRMGMGLGVDYGLTWSCYDPTSEGRPCGGCDSCLLRARGFTDAGVADPLLLQA